jgi:hypothetical protein
VNRFEARPGFVETLSGGRLFVLREGAQRFLQRLHLAVAIAEILDARGLERVEILRRLERGHCVTLDLFGAIEELLKSHDFKFFCGWDETTAAERLSSRCRRE